MRVETIKRLAGLFGEEEGKERRRDIVVCFWGMCWCVDGWMIACLGLICKLYFFFLAGGDGLSGWVDERISQTCKCKENS